MVDGAKVEDEDVDVGMVEEVQEEEDSVEDAEAEVEAEEATEPQPLIPMTQARVTLQKIGGP